MFEVWAGGHRPPANIDPMTIDASIWREFCGELEARTARLANEFSGSWRDLAALTAAQRKIFDTLADPEIPAEGLQSLHAFFARAGSTLLADPLIEYAQKRPIQRSLSALEEHETALDDLLRRLPKVVELSGRDLVELTRADPRSLMGLWRSTGRKPGAVRLRDAVSDHLERMMLARAALDGSFQLLLAEGSLHLLVPWQTCRRGFLAAFTESEREGVDIAMARNYWNDAAVRQEQQAATLLALYNTWAAAVSTNIAAALLRQPRPWRDLEPVRVFVAAVAGGAPILRTGLREAEAAHRAIVREIERAREVVDFGFETARLERTLGEEFAKEAVSNALSLLTYQKGATPEIPPAVDVSAAHAAATLLLESDIALEESRIGLLAHMTRQRSGAAFRHLRGVTGKGIQAATKRLWADGLIVYRWALLKIGRIAPPRRSAEAVIRRADLAETLEVHLRARDLPMIYRRLFRVGPVEDPRFLVGREAEMAGFDDALGCWTEGKGASVIVIGARGTGKTSLMNCAASGVFPRCEVVRGQFSDRLVSAAQMAGFVRGLLRIPADSDIVDALSERRRVVLVEEFERTFLRTINGFAALRMLLNLMYSTGRSTLWIFSVNETAYRYLDAVIGLGRHFSHRVNAMSVKQEDLTNAILQRHNLSGLRLEFAPLPEEDPRVSRIRRFLGFEQDPQQLFLDALYEQSEGIFRAAFELWQGAIERVEGGIVHMRQPLAPNYQKLASEMTLLDCFMLKAILQHGSLTAEEIALVLGVPREESVRQLERLDLLDVLEPEPAGPGVRMRPEAGRLVRETLTHRNLV
jgi:hypothetical protein